MTGNARKLPIALLKQGNRDDPNNYRPISVISFVAKVFESIVYDQLYSYLEVDDIICKYQSGFRTIHSTTMVSVIFGGPHTNVFHQWFFLTIASVYCVFFTDVFVDFFFFVVLLFFLLHSYIISGTSLSCAFFVNIFELRTLIYLNLMLHMNFFKKLLFQCDFSIVVCEAPLII